MSSSSVSPSGGRPGQKEKELDPIVRNALRYTLSAREYQLLHHHLLSRAPIVRKRAPPPTKYTAVAKGADDYNAAAVRASLRLAVAAFSGLTAWDLIKTKLLAREASARSRPPLPVYRSPNARLTSSLALILLFHRLLRRFFARLRESLLTPEAQPFRRRNPRIAKSLTSQLAPAVGSSLAGFFLTLYPAGQLRITIAIYIFTRALEFSYNYLEELGRFRNRPAWFGSWMLMPVACGQLLHAFVFDRDCFPSAYGNLILANSPAYIQPRPAGYPKNLKWPSTFDLVDSLAQISKAKWPSFTSPIMFPHSETLPRSLTAIAPITSPAHPAIKHLSCALLHPNDPSCLRTYFSYWIQAFPQVARLFTMIFTALSVTRYKSFLNSPVAAVNKLAKSILRMSVFICGAIGTSWGSICLFQNVLPRNFLPTQRWFVGGFFGGMWAFIERKNGRGNCLYSARMSIDSLWKVGVKRGWWRGIANGDVLLFVLSLATVNVLYELEPKSVSSGVARKGLSVLRSEGWVDRALVPREAKTIKDED